MEMHSERLTWSLHCSLGGLIIGPLFISETLIAREVLFRKQLFPQLDAENFPNANFLHIESTLLISIITVFQKLFCL